MVGSGGEHCIATGRVTAVLVRAGAGSSGDSAAAFSREDARFGLGAVAAIGYRVGGKTDRFLRRRHVGEAGGPLGSPGAYVLPDGGGLRGGVLAEF